MSDTIREAFPLMTPDSLRKMNQLNNSFYDTHTKKNFGRKDVSGSQYYGVLENFGFQMLLETRKIKMEKPSLDGIFGINNYKYYFDIQYSNMIETYEQQGMLEAVLRKDVFLSNKEYTIKFEDCEEVLIPRSESWGALNDKSRSKVFKDKFYHTQTPPTLMIKDLSTNNVEEIRLSLEVMEGFDADYYFYNGFSTQKFIQSYEDGVLITTPITNNDAGLSFVWICEDIFRSLAPVDFEGNDPEGLPILTIGVDGHDVSHIYPLIYGIDSLPEQETDGTWYLKAESELDGFIPSGSNNHNSRITSIYYVFKSTDSEVGDIEYPIIFEEEYIKITLSNVVQWDIVRNNMNSPFYAEILMSTFFDNGSDDELIVLTEAFDISFSDEYLFSPYEGLCENAVSGIHVDILSDYSENSVPKKNGTIHGLGEFDGLPSYFYTMHDRDIHRSHIELYSIRDRLNRRTQIPTEKQTAGLIFDSGIPQGILNNMVTDEEPAMVYVYDVDSLKYETDMDKVVSLNNIVTEITYNGNNEFGNCNIPKDASKPKFIYHGNMTFSLNEIEFDKETETARVYYVNNDSTTYINNAVAKSSEKKPERTLARMCDIPTTYEQLMHVDNLSATNLFDPKYVRMDASFNISDLDTLMNDRGFKVVLIPDGNGRNIWIYDFSSSLPTRQQLIDNGYHRTTNTDNTYVSINRSNFEIYTGGMDYELGDTFYVLIGGKAIDGSVTQVDASGRVFNIDLDIPEGFNVSIYNTDGEHTMLKTVTVNTANGHDMIVRLNLSRIDISEHSLGIDVLHPLDNLITFAYDFFGNIFLYKLNDEWEWEKICQVEGIHYRNNPYDMNNDVMIRSFDYAFDKYIFDESYVALEDIFFDEIGNIHKSTIVDYDGARGHKGDSPSTDLSEYITGENMPNTLYRLICTSDDDNGHFDLEIYEMDSLDGYKTTLPRFNTNNTNNYYNPSNRFLVSYSETLNMKQPTLFLYSPIHDTRLDSYRIMTDLVLSISSHKTTYNDYGNDIVNNSGILDYNVYYYPEYEFSDEYNELKQTLMNMERLDLLSYIRENIGTDSEPFMFEATDYRYEAEDLVNYILDRYPTKDVYKKDNLKVHGCAGDQVIDPATGLPLGNPITGGIIPLTSEVQDTVVTYNSQIRTNTEPVNIFIIDDELFTGFSNDFRVHDENGVDISSTAIIIWNHDKYIFRNDSWIKLSKPIVDGYYNPSTRKFYYDPSFVNMITPDVDLLYHDLTSGKYYKWNGSNYIIST